MPHSRPPQSPVYRLRHRLAAALAVLLTVLAAPFVSQPAAVAATPAPPTSPPATSSERPGGGGGSGSSGGPAAQALERLIGAPRAAQVTLRTIDKGTGEDRFEVYAERGRLVVAGTTPAVQLTGFGHYLRHVAHADIAINGSQTDLPHRLPLPASRLARDSSVDHRFALNDTNQGYAGPYLSWQEWQRRIDVLALHGINEVLVYEGQEAVYQRTFTEFGYTDEEMRAWIPQPGHQAWWLLQNMCCTDGPVSQHLIDQRIDLGRRMADRLRSLGMVPVLPGYFGTVPTDFKAHNPAANTVPQGTWNKLERPHWLDPTDPIFERVAATFYRVQTELFGPSTMYKMDLLHEGGTPGKVDVARASQAVQRALNTAHPDALWAILGWQNNPLPATLQAIDRGKMFIVDGISEESGVTDRDKDFFGTGYAFGTIWNFGGHVNLGARLTVWNEKFHAWREKQGTAMNGIALMPEAIDNNPAALAFFTDLPWQDGRADMPRWFDDYATARYGRDDPHAKAAWRILLDTVYSWPAAADTRHVTGLYDDQPGLANTGYPLQYDIAAFDRALDELLQVDRRLRGSGAYRYDLVDVARQVLANHSRLRLPEIRAAYRARDLDRFERLTGQWMDGMRLMDRLLGTDENFLLGAWQKEARRQAATPAEAATLDYNLKSLVTLWAAGSDLQDYARREMNGLVGQYYAKRWQLFFDSLKAALRSGADYPEPIDWRAVAEDWSRAGTKLAAEPRGDAYALAGEVAALPDGAVSVEADRRGVKAGENVRVTAAFSNTNTLRPTGRVTLGLEVPRGYRVRATSPARTDRVAAGGTFTTTWTVTVPAAETPGTTPKLNVTADWRSDGSGRQSGGTRRDTASAGLLIAGIVPSSYRTMSNTQAEFATTGDGVGIAAGGADLWRETNELAAAYRPDVLADGQQLQSTVLVQDGAAEYTRSGLVVSDDLATPGATGYANIAVTPGHGCLFSWDSDGDGRLDSSAEAGGFTPPVRVRIGRSGDRLTGSCGTDGQNWTVVGAAAVPGAGAAALDVGVFVSAATRQTGRQAISVLTEPVPAPSTARDSSGDTLRSLRKPVTALSSEPSRGPAYANDGNRANSPYFASQMNWDTTWWQVDLGETDDISRVNVRNYVSGGRHYEYRLEGSLDGTTWYTLGGRRGPRAATDAGDTMTTEASARYVRVVGTHNTANLSFHLTEVSVYGTPTP
ncbi:alpha-N-acetylglucosaminidase C-terminal domain-containing protein [Nonomuraea fuscirosea]|uniref:alpha-N-acetylglucosaminidase TIM-barrel domain-containing protein n=1 Tax=Nonomuraea fuscirosea TaxID=1291556 RepID=UPI002DD7A792|nr:alpha-N-acetylglucosaminidase TIM-barrel domain-containing protein [Nonomuraea fuscirosea]WSA55752.1 alpha-N-acetylglucosaminidase C-terminal domain-containing protein [Nonomuraea fuscirosea]